MPSTIAINHGIFATSRPAIAAPHGSRVRVGFTFEARRSTGSRCPRRPSPSRMASGSRSAIADESSRIGEHRYVIRYRTTRADRPLQGLSTSSTGTPPAMAGMFPIDLAEARIRLPSAGRSASASSTPARRDRPRRTPRSIEEKPGEIRFRTTHPLGPYEGLTVAVAFPEGRRRRAEPRADSLDWLRRLWPADRRAASACSASSAILLSSPGARRPQPARRARSCRSSRRPTI